MISKLKFSNLMAIVLLTFAVLSSFSFSKFDDDKKYGGIASVTLQVIDPKGDPTLLNAMHFDKVKPGDRRVLEVSVNCSESSYSDAQKALQYEISVKTKAYEKSVSSIRYDISSCD